MSTATQKRVSITHKLGLKPLTCTNFFYYYLPAQGVISYTSLSVNVMNPSLTLRLFPRRDITNILLVNALVGSGLYLYSRPHLRHGGVSRNERILYSAFGAASFSLGSVLIWAILRNSLPDCVALGTLCGLGTSLAFVKIGTSYAAHLDTLVDKGVLDEQEDEGEEEEVGKKTK